VSERENKINRKMYKLKMGVIKKHDYVFAGC
jgi:hypothetical protein